MPPEGITAEKRLEVLHDHYKETFGRQRDLERSRDRLFLWLIVLFAVLSVEIGYPAQFTGSVQKVSILGTEIDLTKLPLAALLTATWVLTFAVALRYCQTSIAVDRQYPYVHRLEEAISPMVGGGELYHREGKVYLRGYPLLLNAAFYAYNLVFPTILIIASAGLWWWERNQLSTHWLHKAFDAVVAFVIVCCFVFYRMQPYIWKKLKSWRLGRQGLCPPE